MSTEITRINRARKRRATPARNAAPTAEAGDVAPALTPMPEPAASSIDAAEPELVAWDFSDIDGPPPPTASVAKSSLGATTTEQPLDGGAEDLVAFEPQVNLNGSDAADFGAFSELVDASSAAFEPFEPFGFGPPESVDAEIAPFDFPLIGLSEDEASDWMPPHLRELLRAVQTARTTFRQQIDDANRDLATSLSTAAKTKERGAVEAALMVDKVRGYLAEGDELLKNLGWTVAETSLMASSTTPTGATNQWSAVTSAASHARSSLAAIQSAKPTPPSGMLLSVIFAVIVVLFAILFAMIGASGLGVLLGLGAGIFAIFWYRSHQEQQMEDLRAGLYHAASSAQDKAMGWKRQLLADEQAAIQRARATQEAARHEAQLAFELSMNALRPHLSAFAGYVEAMSPSWFDLTWQSWIGSDKRPDKREPTATELPTMVPVGALDLGNDLDHLSVPAVITFPRGLSLMIETAGDAKEPAMAGIQALLLRLLATAPPATIQMTLFDPVGLGRNVAAITPLGDVYPRLINSRVWTESAQFDKYLNELTDRIAEVHQKYLRKDYKTIADYNRKAKVPQSYHLLVVANFPAKFSEETANRLKSVAEAGPDCGVFTILTVDPEIEPPHGFSMPELKRSFVTLTGDSARFRGDDPDLAGFTIELASLPEAALANEMLKKVGQIAEQQSRIEVPFSEIMPAPEDWWSEYASTATGIDVPIGLASATKVQRLSLGKDTAQHVLVAGRTGSGKSTLFHVLITSLALTYSPDELHLYLIDFKQGVEFKTYANPEARLPHARVIAIESEREFGLSVLHRLDREITNRGNLFRSIEDQDIAKFRAKTKKRVPRIVLIVDEFQEFFTGDDTLASEAALILDRLVRQGRAFGIHVVLGSQTLGGAFTLARGTMDQMGVRIALQCSETDSRLILSDDNPMARLLSRAGEAIYNDHDGRPEGNSMFQTVWLRDDERERLLRRLAERAKGRNDLAPLVVFEGNSTADVATNHLLNGLLDEPTWPQPAAKVPAWLGDPIAIKDPTAAFFRRQSGSNLLFVGQNEPAAAGMVAATIASLAAHHLPSGDAPIFYLLDFTSEDAEHANLLGNLLEVLPHVSKQGKRRQVATTVAEIATELTRRMDEDLTRQPPIYLVIQGLMRARDLRPEEADFFSAAAGRRTAGGIRFDDDADTPPPPLPPSPAEQFPLILREGPDLGIHTIAWCDTAANLGRVVNSQLLREFDLRVVFQMSVENSNTLIGSMAASGLGAHRAILYSEEDSRQEKFRPYGLPSPDWIAHVGSLRGRAGRGPDS